MPPRSPGLEPAAEVALARRVQLERERNGWSPAGLASRMTQAGCPMTQSGIWKIENGTPRRRISFHEAVTFAQVFGVSLEELSKSPEVELAKSVERAATEVDRRVFRVQTDVEDLYESSQALKALLEERDGPSNGLARKAAARIAAPMDLDAWMELHVNVLVFTRLAFEPPSPHDGRFYALYRELLTMVRGED